MKVQKQQKHLCFPLLWNPAHYTSQVQQTRKKSKDSRFHVIALTILRRRVVAVRGSPATTHAEQTRVQAVCGYPALLRMRRIVFACASLCCGIQTINIMDPPCPLASSRVAAATADFWAPPVWPLPHRRVKLELTLANRRFLE